MKNLRIVLLTCSSLLCAYAAWRFWNLVSDIDDQGMIPQLWIPLLTVISEVTLLMACIGLLFIRMPQAKWAGFAYAGLWVISLFASLPTQLPPAFNTIPVSSGVFSQADLSRKVLLFHFGMALAALLLAWGIKTFVPKSPPSVA